MKRRVRILLVLFVATLLGIGLGLGFEAKYWERVYPNVRVSGVNLGGKRTEEAEIEINNIVDRLKVLTLGWGNNEWEIPIQNLGIEYDVDQTVNNASSWGRSGNLVNRINNIYRAINNGVDLEIGYSANDNLLVSGLATITNQINIPAKEPEISFDIVTTSAIVTTGENGLEVDERELVNRVREWIKVGKPERIEIPVFELRPKLNEVGLERAKKRAENLADKSLTIQFDADKQTWKINRDQILVWLDPQNNGWKRGEIEGWVTELAHSVDRPAQNASVRIGVVKKIEEFKPAKNGYLVNQAELVDQIIFQLSELEISDIANVDMKLLTTVVEPEINTGDVNNLGIKELLGKGESWYAGSITNRIFNLKKAAEYLSGTLIAPGETFSFNKTVGEISSATGYKSAYIIKEGKTILGDGGGVCQTSSTLFRAVLAAGLPIEERTAHAYRVSYYEQSYQPGFDATVFQPAPDFKFKNDTPAYVLIQMEYDEKKKYLAFSLYGTSDGRKVELSKARVWDVTPPPPDLYIDDPNLPTGQVTQTEHKANGAKVAFDWKVTRGDEVVIERTFYSNYRPWQAVYLRGTKTQ